MASKLAVVTGAASGIGKAVCSKLISMGAKVVAVDKTSFDKADITCSHASGILMTHQLDVSKKNEVSNLYERILSEIKTPPQILVNSAGITRDDFMIKISEENWDKVMDVNLKGTFFMSQIHAQHLIKYISLARKAGQDTLDGSIINISSISAKGNVGQANYSASKAGVIGFTKTCAQEFGRYGIRVNAVLPGYTETPMTDVVPDKVRDEVIKMIPLGRVAQPSEIANLICFLAGDESSFMTGTAVECDGGLRM